jgi:CBS domain-containing protein
MQPDDAADLLSELAPEVAERLLQLMEPDEAADLRRLLTYDEDTAGGLMTTEPVILGPEATIAEALAVVRRVELSPPLLPRCSYAVLPWRRRRASSSGWSTSSASCASRRTHPSAPSWTGDLEPLLVDAPLGQVTRMLATYNLVGVPVVDDAGRLLGAVTVDDVLDHLLPEDWREDRHEVTHGRLNVRTARASDWTSRARPTAHCSARRPFNPETFGRASERFARSHGDREVPGLHDGFHHPLDRVEHPGDQRT